MDTLTQHPLRIALVWRGDPVSPPDPATTRQWPIMQALAERGADPEIVLYDDDARFHIARRLRGCDGVLVWVDPLSEGRDRSHLDPLLRDLAAHGVFVSTHPDTIMKMGVKEVLYRTRDLGWGGDVRRYVGLADLQSRLPAALADGPRVIKRNRGNGGQGVWKVEASANGLTALEARRGSKPAAMSFEAFLDICLDYFADGPIIDQAFQPRLPEGMTRVYLSAGRVVGYGRQLIKALVTPPAGGETEEPGPRIMHPPEAAPFQVLRRNLEDDWVPGLCRTLDLMPEQLPALWDADFLLGPRDAARQDTHVLCEINVSSVAPFPPSAAVPVAEFAIESAKRSLRNRSERDSAPAPG